MSFLNYADKGEYSQFGECGLINEAIKRIGLNPGTAIEFGAPTKSYCSNIYHLKEDGWNLVYYDMNPQEPDINQMFVTTHNVNTMPQCSIWSCDTDGPCAEIWAAYEGLPDIVIIEINSSLPPYKDFYSADRGANYSYMKRLGENKGYKLLAHTGNLVWVLAKHEHLFPDADETFNTSWQ